MSTRSNVYYKPSTKDQDTSLITEIGDNKLYLVLDGHGPNPTGKTFVNKLKEKFSEKFAGIDFTIDITSQMKTMFNEVNNELNKPEYFRVGSTATLVIITKEKMFIVTVGDSDVYLFSPDNKLTQLNAIHSGTSKTEMLRLKAYPSMRIEYTLVNPYSRGPTQVWNADDTLIPLHCGYHHFKNRMDEPAIYMCAVGSQLASTRSIGDYALKPHGIICEPDISEHPVPLSGSQLLIASDGFWDCWTREELITELSDASKKMNIHNKSVELNNTYFVDAQDDNTLIHIHF